jgi:hypothetical protein
MVTQGVWAVKEARVAQQLDRTKTRSAPCCSISGQRNAMDCLACGAEMRLMQVDQRGDPASEVAFERHTFKCSACPQVSQRLVFSRTRLPRNDLRSATRSNDRPPAKLQMKRAAAESALAKVAEKLRNRQMATRGRASVAIASIWQDELEKLQNQAGVQERAKAAEGRPAQALRSERAALHQRAMPAGTSSWAEVVEKVRTRQIALKERARVLSSPAELHGCTPEASAPPSSRSGKSDQ